MHYLSKKNLTKYTKERCSLFMNNAPNFLFFGDLFSNFFLWVKNHFLCHDTLIGNLFHQDLHIAVSERSAWLGDPFQRFQSPAGKGI